MRTIKFRSAHYKINNGEFSHFSYWGLINHKGIQSTDCFSSPSSSSDSVRKHEEQFTGLTDKNGVEIYEGDIIEVLSDEIYSDIPQGFKGVVNYAECGFFIDNLKDFAITVFQEIAELEVIGNIHENKDLL